MKWILMWAVMNTSGAQSFGSQAFDSADACLKAQKLQSTLSYAASLGFFVDDRIRQTRNVRESSCINSETGEIKTNVEPRTTAVDDERNRRR